MEDVEDVGSGYKARVLPEEGDHGVELLHDSSLQTEYALNLVGRLADKVLLLLRIL